MPLKVKHTGDIKIDSVKLLVYGKPGTGKTRLAASAPSPIIISTEHGLLSLRKENLPYFEVSSIEDVEEALKILSKSNEYQTIVLDSISEVTEFILAQYEDQLKNSNNRDRRQAYMLMAKKAVKLIKGFRDIPKKHVLFTCKEASRTDEETESVYFEPGMPGRVLPNNIAYMFDEVFALRVDKKGNSWLQTKADAKREHCKDRSGTLAEKEEPNLTKIFDKMMKGV